MTIEVFRWILNCMEFAAALTGFVYWRKLKNSYWKWFPFYLLMIVCIELCGKYMAGSPALKNFNPWLYRYTYPFRFAFLLWLAIKPLQKKEKTALAVFGIYMFSFLLEEFLLPFKIKQNNSVSIVIGYLGLISFCMLYLFKTIRSKLVLSYKSDMHFWFSAGLIIFYLIFLPFHVVRIQLAQSYPDIALGYWYVQMVFNYTMYLLFCLMFIWGNPKSSY